MSNTSKTTTKKAASKKEEGIKLEQIGPKHVAVHNARGITVVEGVRVHTDEDGNQSIQSIQSV